MAPSYIGGAKVGKRHRCKTDRPLKLTVDVLWRRLMRIAAVGEVGLQADWAV